MILQIKKLTIKIGNTQENINNNVYSSNFAENTYNTDIWLRNNIYQINLKYLILFTNNLLAN